MPLCPPIQDPLDTLPITPPDSAEPFEKRPRTIDGVAVKKALHVLANERAALMHLENLYASSASAQSNLSAAINQIIQVQQASGKVVFTGIGKSRLIALKLVATFISLGIHSVFLHPTDALHGDLGMIRPEDVVLMITFSGKTSELTTLLSHIPTYVPLMVLTSHLSAETCPLLTAPKRFESTNILLPAPIHESETSTFGLSAPTTSTTVALALGDSLALSVADKLHCIPGQLPAQVFAMNHPGGAIGAAFAADNKATTIPRMSDIAIKVTDVPIACSSMPGSLTCLEVLLAAVRAPSGWVRTSSDRIVAPRRCQQLIDPNIAVRDFSDDNGSVVVEKTDWISVLGDCTVRECKEWVIQMRGEGNGRGKEFLRAGTIFGIVDHQNEVSGVVEIEDVLGDDFVWD